MVTRRIGTGNAAESEPRSSGRTIGYLRGGRFTLERELGSGGEGVVYLARDRLRRDRVAIKKLHLEGTRSFGLLKREFRFLKGLIHPNLVPLYELFADEDEAFFSMAFVEGQHFSEAAGQTHPLRPVLGQLIDVVTFLHYGGIVHRDLKPSNILVRPDGQVTLVDFGAALRVQSSASLGPTVGTPEYMAPELLRGEPPTARSDAYAVGLILYECLARTRPNPNTVFPRLKELVPEVPEDIDDFCAALLEPDPRQRSTLGKARALLRSGTPSERRRSGELGPRSHSSTDTLVGRDRELLQLDTAFARTVERSEPILVFISGQSGLGKTALLEHFKSSRKDALVLFGRCSDSESIRYKALDCVVSPLLDFLGRNPTECAEILDGVSQVDKRALTQLFPELADVMLGIQPAEPDATLAGAPSLRSTAARALTCLLERVSKVVPLVVLLDDLQWGDEDSARILYEAFSSTKPLRCLLVMAYRVDLYAQSRCMRTLREGTDCLEDELDCADIHLRPLDSDDTLVLALRLAGEQVLRAEVEQMATASSGIPLHILELVNAARAGRSQLDIPLDYESLLWQRLGSISPAAHELFILVCLSGSLPLARWPAHEQGCLDRAVSEVSVNHLCRTEAGGTIVVPFHDAVRAVALAKAGSGLRERHKKLAEIWQQEPADAGRVASHYAAAGEHELSESWALRAGDEALSRLLVGTAVDFYGAALECARAIGGSETECERKLAEALADAGRGAEAAPMLAKLAKEVSPDLAMIYRRRAAEQWLSSGAIREGLNLLDQVYREVGLSWPHSQSAAIAATAMNRAAIAFRRLPRPDELSDPAADQKRRLDVCRTAWTVAHVSPTHGAANSSRYVRLAMKYRSKPDLPYALGMEACYRSLQGTQARRTVELFRDTARGLLREHHHGYAEGFLAYVQGQTRYFLSEVREAYPYFEQAERVFVDECKAVSWELAANRLFWASSLTLVGKLRELDRRMRLWLRDAQSRKDQYASVGLQIWNARRIALRDGEAEEALALVDSATAGWTSPYLGTHAASAHIVASHALLICGRPQHALSQLIQMEREVGTTMLRRTQILRNIWLGTQGICHLTLALQSDGSAAKGHLEAVRKLARRIRREDTLVAQAAARHLDASVSYITTRSETAVAGLRDASERYRGIGFELHAASIDLVVGRLLGGDEGETLMSASKAQFERADVDTQGGPAHSFAPDLSLIHRRQA